MISNCSQVMNTVLSPGRVAVDDASLLAETEGVFRIDDVACNFKSNTPNDRHAKKSTSTEYPLPDSKENKGQSNYWEGTNQQTPPTSEASEVSKRPSTCKTDGEISGGETWSTSSSVCSYSTESSMYSSDSSLGDESDPCTDTREGLSVASSPSCQRRNIFGDYWSCTRGSRNGTTSSYARDNSTDGVKESENSQEGVPAGAIPTFLDPQHRRQMQQNGIFSPSYRGKFLFSPSQPSSSPGQTLHQPPSLSLTPSPQSILRRRESDQSHSTSPRESGNSSLKSIEDMQYRMKHIQGIPPPPPLLDAESEGGQCITMDPTMRSEDVSTYKTVCTKKEEHACLREMSTSKIECTSQIEQEPQTMSLLGEPCIRRKLPQCSEVNGPRPSEQHSPPESQHCVHFDPLISVLEYVEGNENGDEECLDCNPNEMWFSEEELEAFKKEAVTLAHRFYFISSSFATSAENGSCPLQRKRRALFSLPVLKATEDDNVVIEGSKEWRHLLLTEIRNILVVDPQDVFLGLFRNSIGKMLPHANIVTVSSGADALRRIQASIVAFNSKGHSREFWKDSKLHNGFDIIIVEERLHNLRASNDTDEFGVPDHHRPHSWTQTSSWLPLEDETGEVQSKGDCVKTPISGSQLLHQIRFLEEERIRTMSKLYEAQTLPNHSKVRVPSTRRSLLIGVSAFLGEDCEKLQRGGADMLWGKPPPVMNNVLRNELLSALLTKRGHPTFACG